MIATNLPQENIVIKDEELVLRIIKGQSHLYEKLIRKYNPRLYRISMSIINDDMEAEDIMQTTYINAYNHLKNFKHKSSFGTWLTRILINESFQRKKKKKKQQALIEHQTKIQDNNYTENPLKTLLNKELNHLIEKAVERLPEKYKTIFVMREIESMSVKETMQTLNLTEANVKVRLNRAKEILRESIGEYVKPHQFPNFHLTRCSAIVINVFNKI